MYKKNKGRSKSSAIRLKPNKPVRVNPSVNELLLLNEIRNTPGSQTEPSYRRAPERQI